MGSRVDDTIPMALAFGIPVQMTAKARAHLSESVKFVQSVASVFLFIISASAFSTPPQ
jgi:hypothetical protein